MLVVSHPRTFPPLSLLRPYEDVTKLLGIVTRPEPAMELCTPRRVGSTRFPEEKHSR